jgi:response regulator RpfG family c-di-GMP phosphodiesterase
MKIIHHAYLVDDNEFVLMISEKLILNHPAFEKISNFTNGLLALDSLKLAIENKEQLPEVIFLDLSMPVMNGWEFLNAIAIIPEAREIAVYLFTASKDPEDVEKATTYFQVKGFISKSLAKVELDMIAS